MRISATLSFLNLIALFTSPGVLAQDFVQSCPAIGIPQFQTHPLRSVPAMALRIHTLGTSTLHRQAERAVMTLEVSSSGPTQSSVSQDVTSTSNTLQSLLHELSPKAASGDATPDAAVTHWTMSSFSTGSDIPWDNRKKGHAKRAYTARTSFEIEFRNFSKLGEYASEMANFPYVSVQYIDWRLTDETKEQLGQLSRKEAVKDAMAKARDYVDVLGKKHIRVVEVNDAELEGYHSGSPGYVSMRGARLGSSMQQDESLSFIPESCEVQCSVKVQFEAE